MAARTPAKQPLTASHAAPSAMLPISARVRILSSHLHRLTTFEDYCRERWGWGRNYANKQIAAMETALSLGTTVPTTERQVRPLASLPVEEQAQAWAGNGYCSLPIPARAGHQNVCSRQ